MARFKRQSQSQITELNLVPMLDVLMTVLTFFIIISMTLTLEKGVEIELPNSADNAPPPTAAPEPMVVQLAAQGQLQVNNQSMNQAQLEPQLKAYLASSDKGFVVLQADPNMPYADVIKMLSDLKEIGGDRISLAIE